MKQRIVIYHDNCVDGFTAAWVAWLKFGEEDTEYLAANYGDPPPNCTGRDVFILDFSYRRATLLAIAETAKSIVLIDHHKTAAADLEDLPFVTFNMNRSGAGLAFEKFFSQSVLEPWLVDYVEDRDLWRFNLPDSKEVNAWIGATERTFSAWSKLCNTGVATARDNGRMVLSAKAQYVREALKNSRIIQMVDWQVPCVNTTYEISELVGELAKNAPFAVGWFQRGDGMFIYSLRSRGDGVDVSEVAKLYGGGGHREAAGFQSDRLLF